MGWGKSFIIAVLFPLVLVWSLYYYNNREDFFDKLKNEWPYLSMMVASLISIFGVFLSAYKMKDKLKDNKILYISILLFIFLILSIGFLYGYSNISKKVEQDIDREIEAAKGAATKTSGVMKFNLVISVILIIIIIVLLSKKKYKPAGILSAAGVFIILLINIIYYIINYFIENSDNFELSGAGLWGVFMVFLIINCPILFKFGGPLKGKKEIFMFLGSLLSSYAVWTFGISRIVSNIYDNDKQYILFTDYTRRIMDSSYTELEDMTTSQSNRFYARTILLGILYFVTPVGIFYKIKKMKYFPTFYPFWLFVLFPLISTFVSHDCVLGEPDEDKDLYYTIDNILKMHTFTKVDDDVE